MCKLAAEAMNSNRSSAEHLELHIENITDGVANKMGLDGSSMLYSLIFQKVTMNVMQKLMPVNRMVS